VRKGRGIAVQKKEDSGGGCTGERRVRGSIKQKRKSKFGDRLDGVNPVWEGENAQSRSKTPKTFDLGGERDWQEQRKGSRIKKDSSGEWELNKKIQKTRGASGVQQKMS